MRKATWKSAFWILAFLTASTLLSGCKDFWNALPSSGGGGGKASGVFYVLNQRTSQIAEYSIAKSSTTPAALSGSPIPLGQPPLAVAISPTGNDLYVSTGNGIYLYNVGSGGALTLASNSDNGRISTDPATTMAVDPTGQWLIEGFPVLAQLNAIPLVTSTGLNDSTKQTQVVPLPVSTIQQVAVSPSSTTNPYAFVALGTGGTAVIPFTAANANPFGTVQTTTLIDAKDGGADNAVAVDPSNRLVYIGETIAVSSSKNNGQTGGLRVFSINSSSSSSYATEVSGSPYPSQGTGPSAILATANYVYIANQAVSGSSTGNIAGFAVTSTGGVYSLTYVSTVGAGALTAGLAEDSSSTYVLAVNSGSAGPDLEVYTFDATTTGKLNYAAKTSTGTDPVGAVAVMAVP